MLILTRHPGESIRIGDNVTFTVAKVYGPNVVFHVTAPKNIRVVREEIYKRVIDQRKKR